MSLADYLAKNYLTADPKPEKKSKKRKRKDASNGLTIADDDDMSWDASRNVGDDDDGPITVTSHTSEFRKAKSSNWHALPPTDHATADAILAAAANESAARATDAADEAPAISGTIKMDSGAHAGLQTGAQLAAQLQQAAAAERAANEADPSLQRGAVQETIYRDASGRVINIAMKRAEARTAAAEKAAAEAAEREAAGGDVQRVEREARREKLAEARLLPLARYADDEELNEELKEVARWNDPAAGFLSKKKAGKSVTGRPLYQGPAAPNRYGIRPGYRWDGVDRGNGFEGEYFKAQNRRKNLKALDYAWQMDE